MTSSIKHRMKAKRKNKMSKKGEWPSSSLGPQVLVKVWQPGVDKLEEGKQTYYCAKVHRLLKGDPKHEAPTYFDIVRDTLGLVRTEFPHMVYFMAETQAEKASWNSTGIFKVTNISGKRHEPLPKLKGDEAGMDDDESDDKNQCKFMSYRCVQYDKERDSMVAYFEYHKHPITSIEWSPHEASSLVVSSSDNQLIIWDLSLEKDEEEDAEFKAKTQEVNAPQDLPPQLLFIHQRQKDLKELHWHTKIPGMIMSTASDGFNILMPSNIQSTLPSDGGI
ncbi:hypothetical protein TanjilG_07609 [Lupinus angustifolius]|uniref:Uncharacterized protein n=1 Tax=Lupinus angustifolius TaxID=3871 RepID=A0A1J7HZ41_LUPAN|nr:hypothetical protein TanjilG_07609 [Lupinus angustifolius]